MLNKKSYLCRKSKTMKKLTILFLLIACAIVGCRDFYPAQMALTVDYNAETKGAICTSQITDDGGCPFFTEQGICYGFYPEPSLIDGYSDIDVINKLTEELEFSTLIDLPLADTIYYVRTYVKTNAGIGYSDIVEVSTHLPE